MLTRRLGGVLLAATLLLVGTFTARAQQNPITIGFGMALTGGLAPNGKAALFAMQIWEKEINAKGGLLGRPVKLVYYDDQSNPATVPGIYTKLLDVDKVDIVVSGYATNMVAPAMPIVIGHNRTFISLFGLAVNTEFNYPKYFSFLPIGGMHPRRNRLAGSLPWRCNKTPNHRPSRWLVLTRSFRATRWMAHGSWPRNTG